MPVKWPKQMSLLQYGHPNNSISMCLGLYILGFYYALQFLGIAKIYYTFVGGRKCPER
jgi:hypothetical protein